MWTLVAAILNFFSRLYPRRHVRTWPFWLLVFAVVAFLGVQAWLWLKPSRVPLSPDQAVAVRQAVSEAVDRFAADGGVLPARAAVVPLRGDPTDEATEFLRAELAERDGWTLLAGSPVKTFLKQVGHTMVDATGADEYLRPGARVGIDVVFHGRVLDVSTTNGISRTSLALAAYDTRRGTTVFSETFVSEYPKVRTAAGRAAIAVSHRGRVFLFSLFALVLPFAAAPLVFVVAERKSNLASATLMGGLAAIDLLLIAFFFYGLSGHAFALCLSLAVCFVYNLFVCEMLARRRV